MTPDWLTGLMGICFVELVGAVGGIWYFEGWIYGLVALAAAVALPAIFHAAVPPRPGSILYLRSAAHTLAGQSIDLAKNGDSKGASARREMIRRLISTRPEIARYL